MNTHDTLMAYSDYLDSRGLITEPHNTDPLDDRDLEQLAGDFIEQWSGRPLADDIEEDRKARDGAICWDTTCLNCARLLDQSYGEYARGYDKGFDDAAEIAGECCGCNITRGP